MTGFAALRARLADQLTAAGLAGVTVAADPVPPAVVVGLPEDIAPAGPGGWTCTVPVWLVAPPGDPAGIDALVTMLPVALQACRPAPTTADPDPYTTSGKLCPAYRLNVGPVPVPNPVCTPTPEG